MKKKIIKIIIIIVAIIIGVVAGKIGFNSYMKSKFVKILKNSDSKNYELTEMFNGEESKVKVRDSVLVSENNSTYMWVSSKKGKRVIMDKTLKTAIITENDTNLQVASLNESYIKEYFENSNRKFKYMGKEENYYIFEFKDKKLGFITCFYLNKETGIIEKMIEEKTDTEMITEFEVKLDTVTKEDVVYPDLTEYDMAISSSSQEQ